MNAEEKDQLVFQKVKRGSQKAFEHLFKKYYQVLLSYAMQLVRSIMLAEEVVQDVFLALWNQRGKLEINQSLKSYLMVSVRNKSLNVLKSNYFKYSELSYSDERLVSVYERLDDYSEEQLVKLVQSAINALPPKMQSVFVMSRQMGMTYQEIADELEISKKTVEAHMGAALKRIRVLVKEYKETVLL